MHPDPLVVLSGLTLSYPSPEGEVAVLRGLDLTVSAGEALAVMGPSGSGKSSLIAVMGGLERPTGGRARVLGHALEEADERTRTELRRRAIGIVFQSYHLVPAMTALENAALPLVLAGEPDAEAAAAAMLERVGLGHRLTHRPSALSGGEQQRVALARAFATDPEIVFADEPTGNLDFDTGARIIDLLFELNASARTTLVLVTHDAALAGRCRRRLHLVGGHVEAGAEA